MPSPKTSASAFHIAHVQLDTPCSNHGGLAGTHPLVHKGTPQSRLENLPDRGSWMLLVLSLPECRLTVPQYHDAELTHHLLWGLCTYGVEEEIGNGGGGEGGEGGGGGTAH